MKRIPQKGDSVSVLGLGRSGMAVIEYLFPMGVHLYAYDDGDLSPEDARVRLLRARDIPVFLRGEGELRGEFVFRSPAVRPDTPRLCRAALRGATVWSEAELFMRLCPATLFGVSGSDGKTTTASLLAALLEKTGRRVYLGGNIGRSLLPFLDQMKQDDLCVLELSSFQLSDMEARLSVGVLTNLSPNHLNWHRDMAEYADTKKRLLQMAQKRVLRASVFEQEQGVRFSAEEDCAYTLREGVLYGRSVPLCRQRDMRIPGVHNVENLLAASAAAEEYIKPRDVRTVAASFTGTPHRMEWVMDIRGVEFYNSSIDTTPSRTAVTLAAMASPSHRIFVLCGGADKGVPYHPLADAVRAVGAQVYLFGASAEKIARALRAEGLSYTVCGDLKTALFLAFSHASHGDRILLSPACTSFDAFADFEARGEYFRRIVAEMDKM